MSDVFKLVDWSSPLQQPQQQSQQKQASSNNTNNLSMSTPDASSSPTSSNAMKRSESTTVSSSSSSSGAAAAAATAALSSSDSSKTTTKADSPHTPSATATVKSRSLKQRRSSGGGGGGGLGDASGDSGTGSGEIQLADLLDHPFGMPLPLFNEFNTLHPYLSLYYLDYFTAINKMNTKLYCTTTLMMSMMKAANQGSKNRSDDQEEGADANEESGAASSTIGGNDSTGLSYNPNRKVQDFNTPLGYTVGATNALFKQRLYDDLDAFVDETDVDLRGNETLKKQLQLTTADLRFADYIIKNVLAMREKQQQATGGAKLVSFKKTTSMNAFSPGGSCQTDGCDEANVASAAMDFEGSDDWIRLNFKWYLYAMLASIVKEDVCARLKAELEYMVFASVGSTAPTSSASDTSQSGGDNSSAGSTSLDNEVVNIDDYIERVNSAVVKSADEPTKFDTTPRKKVGFFSFLFFRFQNSSLSLQPYLTNFNGSDIRIFAKIMVKK